MSELNNSVIIIFIVKFHVLHRYFINRDGKKQKECPLLISIIKNIKANFHDIKYSTYRCVVKLKKLKRELFSKSQ